MQSIPVTKSQRKAWNKQTIIFLSDVALFFILLNTLPFEPAANKGLSLLAFVAILWLTEAVSVTITALFVPILSVLLGLANSREALVAFADQAFAYAMLSPLRIQPFSYSLVALHLPPH